MKKHPRDIGTLLFWDLVISLLSLPPHEKRAMKEKDWDDQPDEELISIPKEK